MATFTTLKAALLISTVFFSVPPAFAQEAGSHDEESMFGSPAPDETTDSVRKDMPSSATDTTDREGAFFSGGVTQESGQLSISEAEGLPAATELRDDILAIGGLMYLRSAYSRAQNSTAGKSPLSSPSYFDVYGDARPSDRIRGFVRARVRYDFTKPATGTTDAFGNRSPQSTAALDQLWMKFDVGRALFITVGKQPLKWGTGRFWNPTDFLNRQVRDPLAVIDERLGVGLVKLHLPVEAQGMNFYAIADIADAQTPEQVGGALRAEATVGTGEVSLSGSARKNQPEIVGVDFSAGVWDVDIRGEAAFRHGDRSAYFQNTADLMGDLIANRGSLPMVDRTDEWIPSVVGGIEYAFNYSDEDSLSLGAEYFYNGAGYNDAEIYPWLLFNGVFRPLYNGKHYAGAYAYLAAPGDWNDTSFIVSTLSNVSDKSYLSRFDYRVTFLTYLNFDAFVNYHYGERGEFKFGIDVPPVPAIPQLAKGLTVPEPRVDAGLGLRIAF